MIVNTNTAAANNANKTTDGSLSGVTGKMNRMRELVTRSGSDAITHGEKTAIQKEIAQLINVMDDDDSLQIITSKRAQLDAIKKRNNSADNLGNDSAAIEHGVRDAARIKEMADYTRLNILAQPSNAVLAQANVLPQSVLDLIEQ